jgi:hypothetical protein
MSDKSAVISQLVFNEIMDICVHEDGFKEYLTMSDHDVAVDIINNSILEGDFPELSEPEHMVPYIARWRETN